MLGMERPTDSECFLRWPDYLGVDRNLAETRFHTGKEHGTGPSHILEPARQLPGEEIQLQFEIPRGGSRVKTSTSRRR